MALQAIYRHTSQCWHEMFFLDIHSWCSYLYILDAHQPGRHLVQQMLMATKQLLSRSARSLDGLKHVFVVGTLARWFNSGLTVDDHETSAIEQTQNSHRNHSRLVHVCLISLITESLSDLLLLYVTRLRQNAETAFRIVRFMRLYRVGQKKPTTTPHEIQISSSAISNCSGRLLLCNKVCLVILCSLPYFFIE